MGGDHRHRQVAALLAGDVPPERRFLTQVISGELDVDKMDYLLRVVVQDMAHYSRFVMDTLLKHPSVQDCKTSFVLDRVKYSTAVPL